MLAAASEVNISDRQTANAKNPAQPSAGLTRSGSERRASACSQAAKRRTPSSFTTETDSVG